MGMLIDVDKAKSFCSGLTIKLIMALLESTEGTTDYELAYEALVSKGVLINSVENNMNSCKCGKTTVSKEETFTPAGLESLSGGNLAAKQ
jgi:hypothetical protein